MVLLSMPVEWVELPPLLADSFPQSLCPEESNCLRDVVVLGVVVVGGGGVAVAVAATQKGPLNPGLHLHFVSYGLEFST